MKTFEIVPGTQIGPLALGMARAALPPQAKLSGTVGELDGLKFELAGDVLVDVWIEDLRKFEGELHFRGMPLARDASLGELQQLFGGCQRVDVKGGVFFNCSGVTIGSDFEGKGKFIQLRLKPR